MTMPRLLGWLAVAFAATLGPALADNGAAPMTNARLGELIKRLDPQAEGSAGFWRLTLGERPVYVVTDERADRMRIMSPVAKSPELGADALRRLMQANFDTALDARYAIARDMLWSVYLRPLGSLREAEFLGGAAQVVNLARSYGTTYSSGGLMFGGGDSAPPRRE